MLKPNSNPTIFHFIYKNIVQQKFLFLKRQYAKTSDVSATHAVPDDCQGLKTKLT